MREGQSGGPTKQSIWIAILPRRGFAVRGKHPEDGRCCLLKLTPAGEKACGSLEESIGDHATDFLSRVPESKRAGVESALASLRDALSATVAGSPNHG